MIPITEEIIDLLYALPLNERWTDEYVSAFGLEKVSKNNHWRLYGQLLDGQDNKHSPHYLWYIKRTCDCLWSNIDPIERHDQDDSGYILTVMKTVQKNTFPDEHNGRKTLNALEIAVNKFIVYNCICSLRHEENKSNEKWKEKYQETKELNFDLEQANSKLEYLEDEIQRFLLR